MANPKLKKADKVKSKPFARTAHPLLTPKAIHYTEQMLECLPPARIKKMLIGIFLVFLEHEHERLPANFKQIVQDYYMLFDFLDKIEEEMKEK